MKESNECFLPQEAHCPVTKTCWNIQSRPAALGALHLPFPLPGWSALGSLCPLIRGLLLPHPCLWDALYFGPTSVSHFSPSLGLSEILFTTYPRYILLALNISWHMVGTWSLLVKWMSGWIHGMLYKVYHSIAQLLQLQCWLHSEKPGSVI